MTRSNLPTQEIDSSAGKDDHELLRTAALRGEFLGWGVRQDEEKTIGRCGEEIAKLGRSGLRPYNGNCSTPHHFFQDKSLEIAAH